MSVSDELLEVGQVLSKTTEDQHHLPADDSWCLMHPEAALKDNLVGTVSNNPSRSYHEDIIHDIVRGSNYYLRENAVLACNIKGSVLPTTELGSSNSMPSISSGPCLHDVTEVNARNSIEKPCSSGGTHQALETKSEFKDGADVAFSNSCSDITHESLFQSASLMATPKVQVMELDDGYDPDRIPLSVFSRSDSLIPAEWSAASNDSLFSIHVGNASFNREAPRTSSRELGRPGELTKADELLLFSRLPTPVETDIEKNNSRSEGKIGTDGMQKDTGMRNPVDLDKVNPSTTVAAVRSSSVSCNSNESIGSTRSFAFPILAPGAQSSAVKTNSHQERHSKSQLEAQNSGVTSKASKPKKKRSSSCFYCFSCFSCRSCCSCSSCSSCSSWFSCGSCRSCFSCGYCCSCCSCFSCSSCWPLSLSRK